MDTPYHYAGEFFKFMIYDLLIIDAKECLIAVDIIELIELT